jgi:hypothetical protein
MKIDCRKRSRKLAVVVSVGGGEFDLGFHDVKEAKELLLELQQAVSDIEWYIESEDK